jgi:hypothetical protein
VKRRLEIGSWRELLLETGNVPLALFSGFSGVLVAEKQFCGRVFLIFMEVQLLILDSSSIIEDIIFHCNPRPACYHAYFYFSFSDRQRQSVESFLRTIVRQLLQQRQSIPDGVRDIYKKFRHAKPPLNVWIDTLKALMSLEGDIFIIVDALDECPAHEGEQKLLLQTLQSLKQAQNRKIRLLVTSRKESSIEGTLSDLVTTPPLGIQTSQVDKDIRTYIQAQLQGHPNMRTWPKPIQEEVEQVLTEKSGGM